MPKHINARFIGLPTDILRELKKARRGRDWSQRELADKVGLPQVHISAIETGKVTPRYNTLIELVRVLGFDLVLVPRALVPSVQALIRDAHASKGKDDEDERPLYAVGEGEESGN